MTKQYASLNTLTHLVDLIKNELLKKVDVESGKGLSTNDYTNEEKSKTEAAY